MPEYTLSGRIESGELAELYRATRDGSAQVVVKLFLPKTSDPAYARALAETTRKLSTVRHPGLVEVFELGMVRHRLAVIQDDVGKVTLGQALTRLNTKEVLLAPGLAVAMAVQMLEAMQQAHGAGVMHGALTPGNVLLTPEGLPAIRDFGALKALFASKALGRQFGPRGRSSYRAPENTRGDELSVEADVYSAAAILYELLTLKEASTGEGGVSTRRGALPPPSRVDRRLNPRLDPIVLRALDQSASRRYRSAYDFAQALRDFLAANGGLPSRDEHRRFVGTLFPAEVNIDHLGPAAFAGSFTLEEVTGAELDPAEVPPLALLKRSPFSGGEVDSAAPTQSALPMLDEPPEAATQPEAKDPEPRPRDKRNTEPLPPFESAQYPTWEAPAASGPVKRAGQIESDSGTRALERRVRVIEDFQALEKKPAPGATERNSGPIPKERLALPTSEMPFVPDPVEPPPRSPTAETSGPRRLVTEERELRAFARQRLKILGYAVVIAALGAAAFAWVAVRNESRIFPNRRPVPGVPGMPAVKAPPFRPDLRPQESKEPKEPRVPKEPAQEPPAPKEACYDGPPRKKAALLTVAASKAVTVRVDGVKVCGGDLTRIQVEPGKRKVTVTEAGRGGSSFVAVQRFELGKETRVVPVFRPR